jgi:hypothetical protein
MRRREAAAILRYFTPCEASVRSKHAIPSFATDGPLLGVTTIKRNARRLVGKRAL